MTGLRPTGLRIRTRLALFNTAAFAVGGGILLFITWVSAHQILGSHSPTIVSAIPATGFDSGSGSCSGSGSGSDDSDIPTSMAVRGTPDKRFAEFRAEVLADLLTRSVLTLILVAALSVLATLWIAGRSLSRIGQVTATARHIGDENLHARLNLVGPADEVKELADTFDTMLDRLQRSFTDQQRFTAHASHELRTPLTIQRTALEIPLAQGRVPAALEPDVRRALAATDRCERLLASLLALARGGSGALRHRPTDLADHARNAVADVLAEADECGVSIATRVRPAPVTGDTPLLAQLVANLVTNAVRHNRPGGVVRVETGGLNDPGTSYVEVVNTGPVVDPGDLPGLLRPFRRGNARAKGSGLGLAVVQAVTETHRGRLGARANDGGGLTVRVELPGGTPAGARERRPVPGSVGGETG